MMTILLTVYGVVSLMFVLGLARAARHSMPAVENTSVLPGHLDAKDDSHSNMIALDRAA